MKTILSLLLSGVVGFGICLSQASAATVEVSPTAISNLFTGFITLRIGGLTNGETVVVDKFLDGNRNGSVDGEDERMMTMVLRDGHAALIAGVTNLNVPCDLDAEVGHITARLSLPRPDVDHIIGEYLFAVSSPESRFATSIAQFSITNSSFSQSVTGVVQCAGTNVAYASVIVLGGGEDAEFVAGTMSDASGNFSLPVEPGMYAVAAFKSNYLANFAEPAFAVVTPGESAMAEVVISAATQTISGRIVDAGNTNKGIPGVFMFLQSENGDAAIGTTTADGSFRVPVSEAGWGIEVDSSSLAARGYLGMDEKTWVDASAGDVEGVTFGFEKASAAFYGKVVDEQSNGVAGVKMDAYGNNDLDAEGVSDEQGNYVCAVNAGEWGLGINGDDERSNAFVYAGGGNQTNVNNGQALLQNFIVRPAPYKITGQVKSARLPLEDVYVFAHSETNGLTFNTAGGPRTDTNGMFSVNVSAGEWRLELDCWDLKRLNLSCTNYSLIISNGDAVVNFDLQPCEDLQVATESLYTGTVNQPYNTWLQAFGCQEPFTWTIVSNSLPANFNLSPNGSINGFPTDAGTWEFTVRVTDSMSSTAEKRLSITITAPPLQIATQNLPNAIQGAPYFVQLGAFGGQPPYRWSVPPTAQLLPTGLTLSTNGVLSGTPATNGYFMFNVNLSDAMSTISCPLSLFIYPPPRLVWPGVVVPGQFQLAIEGVPPGSYSVQYSSNLVQWWPLLQTNVSGGYFQMTDLNATNAQRFYRVLSP